MINASLLSHVITTDVCCLFSLSCLPSFLWEDELPVTSTGMGCLSTTMKILSQDKSISFQVNPALHPMVSCTWIATGREISLILITSTLTCNGWAFTVNYFNLIFIYLWNTGMVEMLRKISMSRAVRTMQELFPEEYDFYPRSWILPEEHQQFTTQVITEGIA